MSQSGATGATPTEGRLRLYTPHPGQQVLHASAERFRVATCGRRWGKTYAAVNEISRAAWRQPRAFTMWVAPTYQQTKIGFRLLVQHFRKAFLESPSLSELRVTWRNGAVTQFRSADNYDAIRGEGIHFLVVDEAAMMPRAAWEEALRPTLSDTQGRALVLSTPKGRNWFWELWCRGQDAERYPGWASWQFPTSQSPYVATDELREAEQSLPHDVWRQEYEAEFLEDSAGVFRHWRQCEHGELLDMPDNRSTIRPYCIGWDVARHADASVIMVMDAESGHVVAFERYLQVDYERQLSRVAELSKRYNGAPVLMDATHGSIGDPLLSQAQRMDIPATGFEFTNQTKQQLIEFLALQMERKQIGFPVIPALRTELEVFQYELTRSGTVRYSAPEGHHDDCVCALALAVWACRNSAAVVGTSEQPRRPPVRMPRMEVGL